MSAFEFDDNINSGKIFLAHVSDLSERYDPTWVLYKKQTKKLTCRFEKIKNLLVDNPQYGANEPGIERSNSQETRYIRITDINEYGLLDEGLGATTVNTDERYLLEHNDILFARSGSTVGKAYIHKMESVMYPCIFAGYMIRFRFDKTKINPDFAFAFTQTNLYKAWTKAVQRAAGQPNINAEEYKNLEFPLPNYEVQQGVVDYLKRSYQNKAQKEAQAAEQIARIDDYLLAELGISVPEADDALKNRMFTVNFSESSGKRFDPLFFYRNFLDQVPTGRYLVEPLSRHVAYFQTGFAAGKGDQSTNDTDVIQLRSTNLSDDRELVFDRNVYIHREALEKRPGDILQPGEVLFNNTNSQELVGKSVLFDLDGDYFCSNHMTRIGTANSLHPDYLAHLLNLYQRQNVFFRVCTNWNNQSGVNNGVLGGVPIPVPPIEQQIVIAQTITDLRSSAKKLRQEAKEELERARQEVERMILAG